MMPMYGLHISGDPCPPMGEEVPGRDCQSRGSILFGQLLPVWRAAVGREAGLEPIVIGGTEGQLITCGSGSGCLDCRQLGSLDVLPSDMSCRESAPRQVSPACSLWLFCFQPFNFPHRKSISSENMRGIAHHLWIEKRI